MTIDYNLLPTIDNNKWNCENCESSIDVSWLIADLVDECRDNPEFLEALLSAKDEFDYRECCNCYHSIWFYDEELKELQNFVKHELNLKD